MATAKAQPRLPLPIRLSAAVAGSSCLDHHGRLHPAHIPLRGFPQAHDPLAREHRRQTPQAHSGTPDGRGVATGSLRAGNPLFQRLPQLAGENRADPRPHRAARVGRAGPAVHAADRSALERAGRRRGHRSGPRLHVAGVCEEVAPEGIVGPESSHAPVSGSRRRDETKPL